MPRHRSLNLKKFIESIPGPLIEEYFKLRDLVGTEPLEQGTVDIFIRFLPEGRVTVRYKENEVDISDTKLG